MLRCALFAIVFCMLGGCIALPLPIERKPYTEDDLGFIESGVTRRQEVYEKLGVPLVERDDGRITVYKDAQTVALAVTVIGAGELEAKHWCVVRYGADDVVASVEVIRAAEGCTDDGICIRPLTAAYGQGRQFQKAIVFARTEEDEAAKAFLPTPDKCGVFAYQTGKKAKPRVTLSGRKAVYLDQESYLYWQVSPGPVSVHAVADLLYRQQALVAPLFEWDCAAGEIYFLNLEYGVDMGFWTSKETFAWSIDPAETGQKLVGERRLVLD